MKKNIYLFATILLLSVLTSVNAKAATITTSNSDGGLLGGLLGLLGGSGSTTPAGGGQCGTNLPINSNIVFLTIAGLAVGVVTLKKAKNTVAING